MSAEASASDRLEVTHDPSRHRWQATLGGEPVGVLEYALAEDRIVMTHTRIDPSHEGRGLGSQLVRAALDEVAAEGTRRVSPACWFVREWIDRHPDYHHLLQRVADR